MILVVDDALAGHLAAALAAYSREARQNGTRVPEALAQLAIAVRGGQARPSLDGPPDADDHGCVDQLTLSYRRAADRLDISDRTLRRLIAAGELQAVRVAGAARVRTSDLEDFVAGLPPVGKEAA